jgi:membrane protein
MADATGTAGPGNARDGSAGELVTQLSEQVSRLVRDELKLAQLEMIGKGKRAGLGIGALGGGGVAALYGVACLLAAAIIGLAVAVPAWLAALIVGAAVLAVSVVAALFGRAQLRAATPPVPQEAVANVKADVETVREGAHR